MANMIDINKQVHKVISDFADIYEAWAQHDVFIYKCLYSLETDFINMMQADKETAICKGGFITSDEQEFLSTSSIAQIVLNAIESDPIHFKKVFKKRHGLYLLFHYMEVEKDGFLESAQAQVFLLHLTMMLEQKLWHLEASTMGAFVQDYKMECIKAISMLRQGYTLTADEIVDFLAWEVRMQGLELNDPTSISIYKILKETFRLVRSEWEAEQSSYLQELYASIKPIDLQSILPSKKVSLIERLKEFGKTVACYLWALK